MGMRLLRASLLVLGLCVAGELRAAEEPFEVLGIGGAGGMYTPSASPHDPELMFISCDMSGSYRSTDGGKTWKMIHWKELHTSRGARPCFLKDAILWISENTLKISRDKGVTWTPVVRGNPPWAAGRETVTHIAGAGAFYLIGTSGNVWQSRDAGASWSKGPAGRCYGLLVLGGRAYVSSGAAFHVSDDVGGTWRKVEIPLAGGRPLRGPAGGMDKQGNTALFGTIFKVGILKSVDRGETWEMSHDFHDRNDILMASNQTEVCYASPSGHRGARQVWRTRDAGKTWEQCFFMQGDGKNVELSWVQSDIHWGYYITPLGLGISPGDPNVVLLSTQGDFYVSRDSGDTWKQHMNTKVGVRPGDPGFRYRCNGLEVTTNWKYLFDPFDDRRTYICYTDIGFARSPDRGVTWIWSARGCPWSNTFYHVVFDPHVKGRMYAATSSRHDIPYWGHISPAKSRGGVCVSDDHALTWRVLGKGQPTAPCTYLCIDPKSPEGKLTFYATFYGEGVYKSTDNGETWVRKSQGLGNTGNMHAFMVKVHPKSGDVFCSITATRHASTFPVPGGIWKSTDGAETWTDITRDLKLGWPCGFALHPDDPDVIYLTAATIPGGRQGGVYKTADGGRSWARLLKDEDFAATGGRGYVHANYVMLHPEKPDHVYLGSNTHGLWMSRDAGRTWKRFMKLPFGPVSKVTFDPKDTTVMYVSTHGGGVWRGHYLP